MHTRKKSQGKKLKLKVMNSIHTGLPAGLEGLAQWRRTVWRRRRDVVAYVDIGASNGPVEAINGRLEHLRGIALGLRNLDHYILRSLIHSRGLQGKINTL
ncbi:transposase [Corynebacterium auriscanis]|uniref:transposase n=1 Tax=Corynebacterium auriscanis TaxID=99807 RepID=UPI003CEC17EE